MTNPLTPVAVATAVLSMTPTAASASMRVPPPDAQLFRGARTVTLARVGEKAKDLRLVATLGRPMELPKIDQDFTPGAAVVSVWTGDGVHHTEVLEAVDQTWKLVELLRVEDRSLTTMRPLLEAPIPLDLRALALRELGRVEGLDAEEIRSLVCDGWRTELTEFAVRYAGRHRVTAAFDCLQSRLDDPRMVGPVVEALGALGAEHRAFAAPLLSSVITSKARRSVRASAVIGLGRIGDHEAVEPLEQLAMGDDDDVAVAAVMALGKLGARRSLANVVKGARQPYVGTLARQHLEQGEKR